MGLDEELSLQKEGGSMRPTAVRIFNAADQTDRSGDRLRQTTCDLRTQVAKCTDVNGEIF